MPLLRAIWTKLCCLSGVHEDRCKTERLLGRWCVVRECRHCGQIEVETIQP